MPSGYWPAAVPWRASRSDGVIRSTELQTCLGARFAALMQRTLSNRSELRIATNLLVCPGNALNAEAG
jgi:hypothetical protein